MIELLVLDVDGCLSDGKIIYTDKGEEIKCFNVKDGLGIASWVRLGKKVAIITGRNSPIVAQRARDLRVHYLYQGVKNKLKVLDEILEQEGLSYKNVAAIGDDLNDLKMLKKLTHSFTPSDGNDLIKKEVAHVLSSKGGDGAVREMIEMLFEKEDLMQEFVELWS